jgi:hypothetical protein
MNRITIRYTETSGEQRAMTCDLGGAVDVVIQARRIAASVLSAIPPMSWSVELDGRDVTEEFAHVVRSIPYGDEGAEAEFFLQQQVGA